MSGRRPAVRPGAPGPMYLGTQRGVRDGGLGRSSMTVTERAGTGSLHAHGVERADHVPWWLWFSVPIVILGSTTSVAGIVVDAVYARETPTWRAEAVGQDIANLVILPALLALAYGAARGSVAAYLAWLGTVVYTAYAFAIYVFAVHFGPLFLLYVAVF